MRHWLTVALAALAIAVAAGVWWLVQHKTAPIRIAVLPLENLGHEPANDYFADGLTDELIRNLSAIEGLAVRSRTSSFALKGKPRNVRHSAEAAAHSVQVLHECGYRVSMLDGSEFSPGKDMRCTGTVRAVQWRGRYGTLTSVLPCRSTFPEESR